MHSRSNENQCTWGMGLRFAAIGGLAAVPLVLALSGCSIPKLGTELDGAGQNPTGISREQDASLQADGKVSAAASSLHDATGSASAPEPKPLPTRYGTVYSEQGEDGTVIVTPHYDVAVPDGALPTGWTYTYRDAYETVNSNAADPQSSQRAGHTLTLYNADGTELGRVVCSSPNWNGVSGSFTSYDTGLTLPDDATARIIVAAPYNPLEQTYSNALDDNAAAQLAAALEITPKATTAPESFGSTEKDHAASSAKDATSGSATTNGEVGGIRTELVTTPVSPYDASGKTVQAANTAEGTLIQTPYYAVLVPSDVFGGEAWEYRYDDDVTARDADTIAGHMLTIYPMGDPTSPHAVTYYVARGDARPIVGDALVQRVSSLAADGDWGLFVAVSNPAYGPSSASGLSDFYDAQSARQGSIDTWVDAADVTRYARVAKEVPVVEATSSSRDAADSSGAAGSRSSEAPASSSARELSSTSDELAPASLAPGDSASRDGEVGGGASAEEEAAHASSHRSSAAQSHDRAMTSRSDADAKDSSERDA